MPSHSHVACEVIDLDRAVRQITGSTYLRLTVGLCQGLQEQTLT